MRVGLSAPSARMQVYDRSRLINIASGGSRTPIGGITDIHDYPHPTFAQSSSAPWVLGRTSSAAIAARTPALVLAMVPFACMQD